MAGRYFDPPPEVVEAVRQACAALPETVEQRAWAGVRWQVRSRTFAHVLDTDLHGAMRTVLTFRSAGDELLALQHVGAPFFSLPWGVGAMGLVVTGTTDWDEVTELLTESFCLLAPKKLAVLVRPEEVARRGTPGA